MCGIVGIVSSGADVALELVQGIRRLEYRGYDSCGVAIRNGSGIAIHKNVGGPSQLATEGFFAGLHGEVGIAHTRWATHGGVSRPNAHPHQSPSGAVVIVHNGVLVNYRELREALRAKGRIFRSETDSEIFAHLVEDHLERGLAPREAVRTAANQVQGTFAFAVMLQSQPSRLWAVRHESPLVVGFAADRVMVASDPLALGQCHELLLLEDGDLVEATAASCEVFDLETGRSVERKRLPREEAEADPELGEFSHYMAKEMAESAAAASAALSLEAEDVVGAAALLRGARRPFLTGMGTAYHMACFGHYLLADWARLYCPAVTADELPDVVHFEPGDVVLGVSQSGETYDTLRAMRSAKRGGAGTVAVCNVSNSSMAREADHLLLQRAGPEIAVLATKSALSQAIVLARIAAEAGRLGGVLGADAYAERRRELEELPAVIEQHREAIHDQSREAAVRFLGLEKWFFLGRGLFTAVALEGALKFKEVTYRHAEGMPAGFLKHGTISLVDQEMGTALFLPPPAAKTLREMTITALEEVHSRGGPLLLVGDLTEEESGLADGWIRMPGKSVLADACLELIAGQYLAYHTARALGRDVDRPRALAKSVTVP